MISNAGAEIFGVCDNRQRDISGKPEISSAYSVRLLWLTTGSADKLDSAGPTTVYTVSKSLPIRQVLSADFSLSILAVSPSELLAPQKSVFSMDFLQRRRRGTGGTTRRRSGKDAKIRLLRRVRLRFLWLAAGAVCPRPRVWRTGAFFVFLKTTKK